MTNFKDLIALKYLLDTERALLLEGNLQSIAEIAGQKEALILEIQHDPENFKDSGLLLASIKDEFERNQELLVVVVQAIEQARDILTNGSPVSLPVSYTAEGTTIPLPNFRKVLMRKY